MAIVKYNLNPNETPPQDVLQRINENYSETPKYDEENPPLTQAELREVAARVKKRA